MISRTSGGSLGIIVTSTGDRAKVHHSHPQHHQQTITIIITTNKPPSSSSHFIFSSDYFFLPSQVWATLAPARPCRGPSSAPSLGQACSPPCRAAPGPQPCVHNPETTRSSCQSNQQGVSQCCPPGGYSDEHEEEPASCFHLFLLPFCGWR